MTGERRVTKEETDALAVLAKRGRIFAVVIPDGIPDDRIKQLKDDVDRALDALVAERNRAFDA